MTVTVQAARWIRVTFLLILLFALAGGIAPRTLAQGEPQQVEMVGAIQAIANGTTLTINSLTVDASKAETTLTYEVGLVVKVQGTLQADGSILAREVKSARQGVLGSEVELVGTLSSLTAASAVVGGQTFDISGAEMDAGLAVGELVRVHLSQSAGGQWIAREVKRFVAGATGANAARQADDVEIVGTLRQIGTGFVVVSGLRINTQNAQVAAGLAAGILVKVEGSIAGGALTAREVRPARADDLRGAFGDDACAFEVEVSSANLRSGPGTGFGVIGFALNSEKFPVVEITGSGAWIKVQTAQGEAWIATSVGKFEHDCSALPVSAAREVTGGSSNTNSNSNGNTNANSNTNANDNSRDDNSNSNDNSRDDNSNTNTNSNDNRDDNNHNDNDDDD